MNEQLQNELIAWENKWQCAAEMAAQAEADLWETKQQLAAERAIADRLAEELKELLYCDLDVNLGRLKSSRDALAAWKEARND